MEQEKIAQDHFIARIGSLPVVHSAWGTACDLYQRTKDRNGLLRTTCNLAEGSVQTVIKTTKPLVEKYQPQIEKVNDYACEKLALAEENYPIITRPTDLLIEEGKEKCMTLVKPVTDRVTAVYDTYSGLKTKGQQTVDSALNTVVAVKDFGVTQVNKGLSTGAGQYALEKFHGVLITSDGYIEKYLPDEDDEQPEQEKEEGEMKPVADAGTIEGTVTCVQALSTKLRRRMFKRAMRDLQGLKLRSEERVRNFTKVDLIEYARTGMTGMKEGLEHTYELTCNTVMHYRDQFKEDPLWVVQPCKAVVGDVVDKVEHRVGASVTYARDFLQTTYTYAGKNLRLIVDVFQEEASKGPGHVIRVVVDAVQVALIKLPFIEKTGLLAVKGSSAVSDPNKDEGEDVEMDPLDTTADEDGSQTEEEEDRM